MGKKPLKGILLDLDNTLYEYKPCNEVGNLAVFKTLARHFGRDLQEVVQLFSESRIQVKQYTKGQGASHSRLLYFQRLIEKLGQMTNPELSLEMESLFWDTFMNKMKLFEGVREFLTWVNSKKVPVAIVSDLTAQIQFRKIVKLNLQKHIDFIVTSEEAGADKPATAIFELALYKLGIDRSSALKIGDDDVKGKDRVGAQAAGIQSITVTNEDFTDDILKEKIREQWKI